MCKIHRANISLVKPDFVKRLVLFLFLFLLLFLLISLFVVNLKMLNYKNGLKHMVKNVHGEHGLRILTTGFWSIMHI